MRSHRDFHLLFNSIASFAAAHSATPFHLERISLKMRAVI
jgi:hypothetical protein